MKILSAAYVVPISSSALENGAVVINHDKIEAVGNFSELRAKFPDASSEDFGEAVIMPGFVNCHSHLELSIMRGFLDDVEHDFFRWLLKIAVTRDQKLSARHIEISALLGAAEGLRAGITCFADIGRNGEAGFKALKKAGLRGIVFQETEFSPFPQKADEDFARLSEKFCALKSSETTLVKPGISPHAPYTVSRRLFELITDFALAEDVKLAIHAAESISEEELMLANAGAMSEFYRERGIAWQAPGRTSVAYLAEIGVLQAKPLLAHCIRTSERELELIGESGSGIAHCPKSNAKFGHGVAPFERFLDKDLKVGLGSDSVASNNICDLMEEGRFAALTARSRLDRKRLVTAREIVEVMTVGGARAVGLDSEIGTLEVGKQADLVVISLAHVAQLPVNDIYAAVLFASSARDVISTIVAGKTIYANGLPSMIDESELKAEVKAISRTLQSS
jgi:cytosine/adenosine deaminase-related metal-dependent hydrolase